MIVRSVTALFLLACCSCYCILAVEGGRAAVVKKEKPTKIPKRVLTPTKAARSRIVGGIRVNPPYKYPSIVSVKIAGVTSCGGTILNQNWVMSAAHCTEHNPSASDYVFTAGEYRLRGKSGEEQVTKAVQMIVHENYNDKTVENDIVLFRVDPPFRFTKKIKPAVLPEKGFKPGFIQNAVGWGLTSDGGEPSDFLLEVALEVISDEECIKRYAKQNSLVTRTMMCSLNPGGGKDACQGDSGGPFYYVNDTHQIVAGIVSWGIGCAVKGNPGVYTEVSHFLDWINSKIGKSKKQITKKPAKKTTKARGR